jgi:hypothetical protein
MYRWTSLFSRVRDSKNRLAFNKFAYKKTKDYCKSDDRFQKRGHFWIAHIREIADKKTAYNEGCLYCKKSVIKFLFRRSTNNTFIFAIIIDLLNTIEMKTNN